ncbi:MAG: hypothetical protein ACRDQ5_25990 [Sciscionella sp.]
MVPTVPEVTDHDQVGVPTAVDDCGPSFALLALDGVGTVLVRSAAVRRSK